jgi:hypothetical protein
MAKKLAEKKPAKDIQQLAHQVLDAVVFESRTAPEAGVS